MIYGHKPVKQKNWVSLSYAYRRSVTFIFDREQDVLKKTRYHSKRRQGMKLKLFGLISVFVVCVLLVGCGSSKEVTKGEAAPIRVAPIVRAEVPDVNAESSARKGTTESASELPSAATEMLRDIGFDFDKYAIRSADVPTLKSNSEWFKTNPGKKVRIEGYCDERGTVEYNLALGQKRADATKSYLINLGVDGKVLETVSYGKEKPLDPGHNEEAWAKNRRVRFEPLK
jgi:peptidoglycan-associated lipoprotein